MDRDQLSRRDLLRRLGLTPKWLIQRRRLQEAAERLRTTGTSLADVAAALLAPCVIIAGEVLIGAREMRTMGIEAAYPIRVSSLDVPTGGDLTAEEVARVAVRVARSWHW